jgi:hypothetical protein
VHFGKRVPKHLALNIARCIQFFPTIPTVLITNRDCVISEVNGLEVYLYESSSEWHQLDLSLSHPKHFRENFWLTSVARFLAIENYAGVYPGEILHVESDVLLASDFPFAKFSDLEKSIAFPIVSKSQGIASILYIRDHEIAKMLVNLTIEMSVEDSQTTDMLILRRFYETYPILHQILPTGPRINSLSTNYADEQLWTQMDFAISLFGGYFDGIDIGYFLFGVDPRNDKGKKHLRRSIPTSYLPVSKLHFAYSRERNFLDVRAGESTRSFPLFSLHIHSKNTKLFSVKKSLKALQHGVNSYQSPEATELVVQVFIRMGCAAITRRLKLLKTSRKNSL